MNAVLNRTIYGALAAVMLSATAPTTSRAQPVPTPRHMEPYLLDTGVHQGTQEEATLGFSEVVRIPGVPWMRLHISEYNLGVGSYITVTSLLDGERQRLDAKALDRWSDATAGFNGDAVTVELHVAPGDEDIFVRVAEVTVGEWIGDDSDVDVEAVVSLCDGDDDRVASTDARVGRVRPVGCTAWLVSNGSVLTAGHCVDVDPDDLPGAPCGPILPDGVLDLTGRVEFNVPASFSDGTLRNSAVEDQFPIDLTSVVWDFTGCSPTQPRVLGRDWAVFEVFPNDAGELAHERQGFFRMTRESPAVLALARITGYGQDNVPGGTTGGFNAQNQTEQTDTGAYNGENSSGARRWHRYRADTMGGNSGGPIIWNSNGLTIGIHTNGGCNATGGSNSGTSFEHNPLENALQGFKGPNTVYVDQGMLTLATADGTIFRPYPTVTQAIGVVLSGGIVSVVTGSYNETMTLDTRMTIQAPVGPVVIGR